MRISASCADCDWTFNTDAPTIRDRQHIRDHVRRKRHVVDVWERSVIAIKQRSEQQS